ncbi:GcrA family cell cycle regulator [Sphingomonas adhaesiva]|uniref:GcrA family cell cycle regulator n=1 Tax=Sphingomonas adhaesiva TaxID=28212 RepID=UPI002FF6EBA6
MRTYGISWTDDRDDQLVALKLRGLTVNAIAAEMGLSRNAVTGRIHRLRERGDPRLPAAGPAIMDTRRRKKSAPIARPVTIADHVAEAMSRGASSFVSAAFGVCTPAEAKAAWQTILDRYGWQAA